MFDRAPSLKPLKAISVGMMVAWNGKGSDCSKLFHLTEVEYPGTLYMPRWVEYFCDPMRAIQHYKTCKLNELKRKSKQPGYGLGTAYHEAFGAELEGVHNLLNDAKG